MASILITPKQIQQATLRVVCGDEQGSAFFISDTLILTARHVIIDAIDDDQEIQVFLPSDSTGQDPIVCTLLGDGDEELDVALLQVPSQSTVFTLPLSSGKIRYNARWETFGFPFEHQISGNRYLGSVRKTNIDKPYDIELINDSIDNKLDYRGLSGAALVVENEVTGIVTYNILDGFGAISILKVAKFLKEHGVNFRIQKDLEDIPENLKEDIDSAVPNGATLTLLDNKLTNGGKYYVLHGSPGSGKTLISATYNFNDNKKVIAGRYFIRLPNDQRPLSYRVSREAFLEWMEDLISQKISGSVYPRQYVSWNQRVANFQQLLGALDEYYAKRNEIGFIIIDGLDDIHTFSSNGLTEFFGLFPETLPENLSFLLAIIRKDSLPPFIRALVGLSEEIKIEPLDIDGCVSYLNDRLKSVEPKIGFQLLQRIAEKSEGHPLYLRYLSEQLKDNRADDLALWIEQLPTIDGDIAKYYERIWLTDFVDDQDKLWVALVVSQLRQPVVIPTLLEMLPESTRFSFLTKFPSIRHLFKVNEKTGIYHSSFALFIEHKSELLVSRAHDHISSFCQGSETDNYSITNIVYHILRSSTPQPAITRCNQQWADECAKISVEPELVLNDITRVESFCLEQGNFTGFTRVKLLMQRIRFRYDNVLALNAAPIARLLLSMGNPTDALKYLVRFSTLIVSDEEALWFLRKFNEVGATEEAEQLLRAINVRYQALFEQSKEEGGIPFRVFSLMAKSKALDSVNNLKVSIQEVTSILGSLKRFVDLPENAGENADAIQLLREHIGSYLTAFVTYHHGKYNKRAAAFRKEMPHVPAEEWTGIVANTAISFDIFLENDKTPEQIDINNDIVVDLEYAIDQFGYLQKDAQNIYAALLEDSRRPEIIKKLITEIYSKPLVEALRKPNGVDADIANINEIINYHEAMGYLDETDVYPNCRLLFGIGWEDALLDRIKLVGFCFGKAWRLRAEGKLDLMGKIESQLSTILLDFRFTLQTRSSWERSYALPEQIFPHLYYKLTRFYMEFVPQKLEGFIKSILTNTDPQLGLYTEGYRNVLSSISSRLSRSITAAPLTVSVLKKLEEHVLLATQNRWERVPVLLEIAEKYARLGNPEKATKVYQQMLDTSMGPTWYKEDQFTLINTALSLPKIGHDIPLFQEFGKQLEFAGGELTFQRYVRVAQQDFIGNLASQENIAGAISYYQYQTLSDPNQIIANAERSTVDAINPGEGYILGARNIAEASGIYNLLKNGKSDPLLTWAFSEAFFINHDIYRYIKQYAILQANCIERLSANETSPELLFLRERLKACVLNEKMNSNRHHYLDDLMDVLPQKEYNNLVSSLSDSGISFPKPKTPTPKRSPEEDAVFDSFNFPGMGKQSNFRKLPDILARAQLQVDMDNKNAATKILAEGLLLLHEGKSDIWMGSGLGQDVKSLWDQLSLSGTIPEILQLLKTPITQHETNDWRVVEKLLRVLKPQLDPEQIKEILEIVRDHIHFMIRDPEIVQGFNWKYIPAEDEQSNDSQLLDLLIWLLDHPYVSVKKRVIQALLMICEFRVEVITGLLKRTISEDQSVVKEICAYLLYRLSLNPKLDLSKTIASNEELKKKLLEEKHFMVKYYFLKTLENLKSEDVSLNELYLDLYSSFPEKVSAGADVEFEEPYIRLIATLVEPFKKLNMLNGVFCRDFIKEIAELSGSLTIYGHFRAGHYLERSYHDEGEEHYRRAVHILRQAFNRTITLRITHERIEEAASILKHHFLDEN